MQPFVLSCASLTRWSCTRITGLFGVLAVTCALGATPADEDKMGKSQGYPVGTRLNWRETPYKVGSFSNYEKLHWVSLIRRGDKASAWVEKLDPNFDWTYKTSTGRYANTREYLEKNQTTGFIVLRDNAILREEYQYDRKATDRFVSMSMGKTLVALMAGLAVADGKIESVEDRVEKYLPTIAGTAYGSRSVRSLLQMSTGLHPADSPHDAPEVIRLGGDSLPAETPRGPEGLARHPKYREELYKPDTRFVYHSDDSVMLGYVIAAAVGRPLNEYFSERIWIPLGAEDDAYWSVDMGRQVVGSSGFTARLRDWARLAGMLANLGRWNGQQIVPEKWILDMTVPNRKYPHLLPGASEYLGYGYQTWLFPVKRRFALLGVFGQGIFIDPETKTALIMTGVWDEPADPKKKGPDRVELFVGLINKIARW